MLFVWIVHTSHYYIHFKLSCSKQLGIGVPSGIIWWWFLRIKSSKVIYKLIQGQEVSNRLIDCVEFTSNNDKCDHWRVDVT